MYENAMKSYEQVSYFTADPLKLVLMCYEGTIASLKLARESYAAKDYQAKALALQKALAIIHELNATLDMKKGGAIALNLRSLYTYMTQVLTEADLKKDLVIFDKVIHMLEELESEWKALAANRSEEIKPMLNRIPEMTGQVAMVSRAWSA